MDLTLWTAVKNSLKGEWVKVRSSLFSIHLSNFSTNEVYNVTPFLLSTFFSDDSAAGMTVQTLKAQITSVQDR